MTDIPSFTCMTDVIGSFDSERESVFPLTSVMKALRNSPIERVWKIFGNEGITVVIGFLWLAFESCGHGGLFPEGRSRREDLTSVL